MFEVLERRRPRARAAIAALALPVVPALGLGGFIATRAGAAGPVVATNAPALDWQGPADCQEMRRVLAGVRRLVGVDPEVDARVRVARVDRHWHLELTVERAGRAATREIDAESCTAAADAAAVILALSVDP